jgi:hypothetical protein
LVNAEIRDVQHGKEKAVRGAGVPKGAAVNHNSFTVGDYLLTKAESPGSDLYSSSGSRVSPVWARTPPMRSGRYWMSRSRFRTVPGQLKGEQLPQQYLITPA